MVKNLPAMWETEFDPCVGKIPWRRKWQPTPVFLPGESTDRGAWRATVRGVGSHGELLICPESGIKREKQGQNLKGQRVHFTVQKGDGLKQAGTVVQMVKNPLAMQETRVPSPSGEDPLEEGTATHSSILAWEIPWTEEPGGLQSMGLQRVGDDRSD